MDHKELQGVSCMQGLEFVLFVTRLWQWKQRSIVLARGLLTVQGFARTLIGIDAIVSVVVLVIGVVKTLNLPMMVDNEKDELLKRFILN